MQNLQQLQKLAQIFNADKIITPEEIDAILKGILDILATYKKGTESLNEETKQAVNVLFDNIAQYNTKTITDFKTEAEKVHQERLTELQTLLGEVKTMISDVETLASNVRDGKDADEEKIVEDVISRIKIDPTVVTVSAQEIKDKLASLEGDNKLDISSIKGFELYAQKVDLDYAIKTLQQQASFLINKGGLKNVTAGTNVTIDYTDPSNPVISASGGGGSGSPGGSNTQLQYNNNGSFGGITGATSDGTSVTLTAPTIATSQTNSYATASTIGIFNGSKQLISADTATYPSLTELSYVKGVTSAIQTQLDGKQATITPAALTKTDDTNVTLTLGGTPGTALLQATSLTLGWTGTLSVARGGTGTGSASITAFNNITGYTASGATGTTSTNLVFSTSPTITTPTVNTSLTMADGATIPVGSTTGTKIGTATTQKLGFYNATPIVQPTGSIKTALSNLGLVGTPTITPSDITSGAALTKTDDTNVTLTLGGTPTTALLAATSLTLGWTGTLAVARGGTGTGSAGITAFNNITGYTASGATGTTSTNLVFSTSPTITTPTFVTSATVPKIIGGTGTTGTQLTFQTTTGAGTTDQMVFLGGTNGNQTFATLKFGSLDLGTGAIVTTGFIELGNASDTTIARASAGQVNIEGVQVLTASNSVTVTGKSISASQITTGTFGTGAYTMDTRLTVPQVLNTPATITVTTNAGTVTRANRINNFTNSSAATMTITMSTTGATDGDMVMVVILDASAVAQTITWVNTENSTVTAPTTSNGSTTLPLTVGFKWNSATSKWRCIASA